uniref:Uncharacterized protein n=1 Tax=Staphylothermus marinus TaxID=2280 RepID=A0A7C4HDK0_STAMA
MKTSFTLDTPSLYLTNSTGHAFLLRRLFRKIMCCSYDGSINILKDAFLSPHMMITREATEPAGVLRA